MPKLTRRNPEREAQALSEAKQADFMKALSGFGDALHFLCDRLSVVR